MQGLAMTLTTQAQLLRMPRATSQALMPTGSLAVSRAATLAVTPATAVTLDVTPAMAGETKVSIKLLACTVLYILCGIWLVDSWVQVAASIELFHIKMCWQWSALVASWSSGSGLLCSLINTKLFSVNYALGCYVLVCIASPPVSAA